MQCYLNFAVGCIASLASHPTTNELHFEETILTTYYASAWLTQSTP